MTKEQKRRLYEAYKLDWMLGHGYTLEQLMLQLNDIDHDSHISEYCGEDSKF